MSEPTPNSDAVEDPQLRIVAVGASPRRIARDAAGLLADVAAAMASSGPVADQLVFFPPLFANVASGLLIDSSGRAPWRAAARSALTRPLRLAAVRFTYPHAATRRLPLLAHHDRVHATLREVAGGLARSARVHVVSGTALLDHPRTHWEGWPDTGNVFHAAWCFDPMGEPVASARDPRAEAPLLRTLAVDPAERSGSQLLRTPVGAVAIDWQGRRMGLPRADLVWAPVLGAGPGRPVRQLLAASGSARVAVRTRLDGPPVLAVRRSSGVIEVARGAWSSGGADLSWCSLQVAPLGKHCDRPDVVGDG